MTRMPPTYQEPHGTPLYWRDEVSGQLSKAVKAYLDNRVEGRPITNGQIALLRDYLAYWVNAPCWDHQADEFTDEILQLTSMEELMPELSQLRSSVQHLKTAADIDKWIHEALDIGMDPL